MDMIKKYLYALNKPYSYQINVTSTNVISFILNYILNYIAVNFNKREWQLTVFTNFLFPNYLSRKFTMKIII